MLRPRPARWFTLLCGNAELTAILEMLARTDGIETVARGDACWRDDDAVRAALGAYDALKRRFGPYWPRAAHVAAPRDAYPMELAREALAALDGWALVAGSLVEELVRLEHAADREALQLEWLQVLAGSRLEPTLAPIVTPQATTRLFVLPPEAPVEAVQGLLVHRLAGTRNDFLVVVGSGEALRELAERVEQAHGRPFTPVAPCTACEQLPRQVEKLRIAREAVEVLQLEVDRVSEARELDRHLATMEWLDWAWAQGRGQRGSRDYAWVTGWAERHTARALPTRLRDTGLTALVAFPTPPTDAIAPVVLDNPRWAAPFERMTRLFGLPGPDESDPSPLLAVAVPLLFGYMFGDLGQGLVIAALGLALRTRFPLAALAIPCGLSAAFFGLLFGSVFGLEGIVPALWVHPIEAPQAVLLPPLVAGVALLLTGSGLGALAAWWHGDLPTWWRRNGGLLTAYLALLGMLLPPLHWPFLLGFAWWLGGRLHDAWRTRRLLGFIGELFEWLEQTVRLLVNTLSFARVGAFALAHAGLSLATVQLAQTVPWTAGQVTVIVLGNLLVLALEGLIVSIQTTRLMLFEFFLRFLRGEGRPLRPLALPRFG
jgi:V/A-type H+-transporting ATPase subunit I